MAIEVNRRYLGDVATLLRDVRARPAPAFAKATAGKQGRGYNSPFLHHADGAGNQKNDNA